jgi:Protein of unknown function (DUF4232)
MRAQLCRTTLAAIVVAGIAIVLAGCTGTSPKSHPSSLDTASSAAPVTSASSSVVADTGPAGPSTDEPIATPSTSAASSAPAPSSVAPAQSTGCTTSGLTVTAISGSGASGQEFATLVFTNTSGHACTLDGYPGVSLLLGGATIGAPAQRSGAAIATLTLAAGGAVKSQLTDYSTCNAANSDTVRVYPPNQTGWQDAPLELRGCRLVVTPVAAG